MTPEVSETGAPTLWHRGVKGKPDLDYHEIILDAAHMPL